MFLAIINDTYAEVKSEVTNDDEFAVMDYFKDSYNNFMFKLGKQKDQIEGIQQAIKVMVSELIVEIYINKVVFRTLKMMVLKNCLLMKFELN